MRKAGKQEQHEQSFFIFFCVLASLSSFLIRVHPCYDVCVHPWPFFFIFCKARPSAATLQTIGYIFSKYQSLAK